MENLATYLGTLFGLIGLVIAFWQNRQKAQLEQVLKANNWFNYQRSNNSNGTLQLAFDLYKEKHADNLDARVIEELARADAFGQEVYKESVRQIHFSEPSFQKSDIEAWKTEGKISEAATPLFLQLVDTNKEKKV
jgi:hypothetical protein